jgi:hypothetical protein
MTVVWAALNIACMGVGFNALLAWAELITISDHAHSIGVETLEPFSATIHLDSRVKRRLVPISTPEVGWNTYPCALLPDDACPDKWWFQVYPQAPAKIEGLRYFASISKSKGATIMFAKKDGQVWITEAWVKERIAQQQARLKFEAMLFFPVIGVAWILAKNADRFGVIVDRERRARATH